MNSKTYLNKIIKTNKGLIILTVLSSVIQAIASVTIAIMSKKLIDEGFDSLLINSLYLLIVIIVLIVSYAINHFTQNKLQVKIEFNLRNDLYKDILSKDYYVISKIHSGELMNYLVSDTNVIANATATILPSLVLMATRLLLAFVFLVVLEWKLAIFLLCIGVVGFLASLVFRKKMKQLHKGVQKSDGIARAFMQESIESNLVIKSFNGEEVICDKNNTLQTDVYNAKIKRTKFSVTINSFLNLVFQGTYAITLIWAVYSVAKNDMGYGTLVALIQLVNQVQGPMMNLSGVLPKYYQMMASIERILEIKSLNNEEEDDDLIEDFDKIEFNEFSFSYDNFKVIENSNLTISKGDFVLIKGISGIGKSTFLKLILGILKPTSGASKLVLGEKDYQLSKSTRNLFSYVPQGNFIFSGTIKENLTFFKKDATDDEINKALEFACAAEFINKLSNGLDTYIGEKGLGLSEGQIQRLAIARAILSNRKIILFDEATSALDKENEIQILKNLKKLDDITCIIVTHKEASRNICDKELVFENTKISIKELA